MADMWKIIRSSTERIRPKQSNHQDISAFLKGEEEVEYANQHRLKESSPPSDEDIQIGEERDKTDYLKELPKLQMKKVNEMKLPDQNKLLKKEYARLYDRMLEMNKDFQKAEKTMMNQRMEKRGNEKEVQRMKTLLRNILYQMPGGAEVKSIIDTSGWKVEDIETKYLEVISLAITKLKQVDHTIEEAIKETENENKRLKQEVVRLQAQLLKIEALEQHIMAMQSGTPVAYSPQPPPTQPPAQSEDVPKPFITPPTPAPSPPETHTPSPPPDSPPLPTPVPTPTPVPYSPPPTPIHPIDEEEEEEELVVVNIDAYVDQLSTEGKYVLEVVGKYGFSRNQELKSFLEKDERGQQLFAPSGKFNHQRMSQVVKTLRETQLMDDETVKLGRKSGGTGFLVFELSKLGKAVYKKITNSTAVMSEKKQLKNSHASAPHGFLIKDSAAIFAEELGYKVWTDRETTTISVKDSRKKVFDMIIEKDGHKLYVEVEMGTHGKEDFFDAMSRIHEVTNEFTFVCPDKNTLVTKTKSLFVEWIRTELGGVKNAKGIIARFTTYDTLKDKKKQKDPWDEFSF